MRTLVTLLVTTLTASLAINHRRIADAQQLPPALPHRAALFAQQAPQVVRIRLAVLELKQADSPKVAETLEPFAPEADVSGHAFLLEETETSEELVQELVEADLAAVISEPSLVTHSGRKATVIVGQKINLRDHGQKPNDSDPELGLTVECTPMVADPDRINLQLKINHSRLKPSMPADLPVISESWISTTVAVSNLQTVVIGRPNVANRLLVLATPEVVPSMEINQAVGSALPQTPPVAATAFAQPVAASDTGTVMDILQKIKTTMNAVAPESTQDISLDGTEFQIQAIFDAGSKVNEAITALSKIDFIEVKTVRVQVKNDQTLFEAEGEIKERATPSPWRPAPAPPTRVGKPQKTQQGRDTLQDVIAELFPDEDIQIRELNSSVFLRGAVSERALPLIVNVAEDFYPSIINDLVVADQPQKKEMQSFPEETQPSKTLADEVRQLRNEVKSLRADVKRVIELLQQPPGNKAASNNPPDEMPVTGGVEDALEEWDMTVTEAVSMGKKNHQTDQSSSGKTEEQLEESIRNKFEELNYLATALQVSQAKTPWVLSNSSVPPDWVPPLQARQDLTQQRVLKVRKANTEQALRKLLGVPQNDGRVIIPVNVKEIE